MFALNAALFSAALLTAASVAAAPAKLPGALKLAQESGMTVVKTFAVSPGLTGFVVRQSGQISVLYGTKDGYLVAGALLAPDGTNLTAKHAAQYSATTEDNVPASVLDKLTYIQTGSGKNPIYVFVDTECAFCRVLHKALAYYEKAGLAVRWVPVALLSPASLTNGAQVLASKDSNVLKALLVASGNPGKAKEVEPALIKAVESNSLAMAELGIAGTPAIIFKKNGKLAVKKGMPRLSELPGITGLPSQKIEDDELARFR